MQIKILDSWLRDYLTTDAKPQDVAKVLSLTSVSVEKLEKKGDDFLYDIEVTTNRVDLMSVIGLAREAAASLSESGFKAEFKNPKFENHQNANRFPIEIRNDPELVNRVCAAVIEVNAGKTPDKISQRLEACGIRSLNNLVDVTNYIMREVGHPAHVFDYDAINSNKLLIRKSKRGERIVTLDNKEYALGGEDIILEDSEGRIVDLLGIMGLQNSVVSDKTKKILFFIDNNEPKHIRNSSMSLGIRTEAAILNEKGVDPNLAIDALNKGIELYKEIAGGKLVSEILDIYPSPPPSIEINVEFEKINKVIGQKIEQKKCEQILKKLGFEVKSQNEKLSVSVPSFRRGDVSLEEDIIEEIARVNGFQNLQSILPPQNQNKKFKVFEDEFYWEERVKNMMKSLGFFEVYTYSLVSEDLLEGPVSEALRIKNPLSEDMKYLRVSLIPSLLSVVDENKKTKGLRIFEISKIYKKRRGDLPEETIMFSSVMKGSDISFLQAKGVVETVFEDLGIKNLSYKKRSEGAGGAVVSKGSLSLGYIEQISEDTMDFELDFSKIVELSTRKRVYKQIAKFPESSEDLAVILNSDVSTIDVLEMIKNTDALVKDASLLDRFENTRTFHVIYQSQDRNLTKEDLREIREKIIKGLKEKFQAELK